MSTQHAVTTNISMSTWEQVVAPDNQVISYVCKLFGNCFYISEEDKVLLEGYKEEFLRLNESIFDRIPHEIDRSIRFFFHAHGVYGRKKAVCKISKGLTKVLHLTDAWIEGV